ncbi:MULTISPECIES: NADPH:quinone oxidoreductase family protein [Micrococcaceae]|uniref:NADPH:quinone oxidoreductase family protein n=1 Tax=Micrococcaceae TaxID=1268 RepID=UPI00161E85C1|nr:NADPH:quinone oxidoreductase family protein [Citricoccus sp.]MBB5750668.1 NADPH2:quinone reductase [Micrococcus sp. TA1]HRO29001.1 NADPH:quinone oxidoreductase family protein [Citricoccus sp.]HRO92941.1 NADPH:quinone oxidoreductase family protein [Citricoccus sp.]
MRAVVIPELSGPAVATLRDVPEPSGAHDRAGGRRILVDVHAAGLSFIDPLQTRGKYQHRLEAPYIAGSEVAGVVLEAPADSAFRPGDRVAGSVWHGGLAERALALEDYLVRIPEGMDFVHAAGVQMNYSTALYALEGTEVCPGGTVLVTGAAGGVGTAVLDIARAQGISTIALVSSDEKERITRSAGATHVLRSTGPWLEEVRSLTAGHGVQGFVDMVGGEGFLDAVRALRIGGTGVVVGFASGTIPEIRTNRLLLRNLTLRGMAMDGMEGERPGTLARVQRGVQDLLDAGSLHPVVDHVYPVERAAEALASIEDRTAVGKVVVIVKD